VRIVGSRPRALLVLLLAVLAAGCSGSGGSAAPATTTTAATTTAVDPSVAAAQYASNTPPDAAEMVCSDEIRIQVKGALGLDGLPTPQSSWADHVYTCTFAVPVGTLVLAVTVAPSVEAAGAQLDALRAQAAAGEVRGADAGERTVVELWTLDELVRDDRVDWSTLGMAVAALGAPGA